MSLTYIDWEVQGVTVLNLSGRLALGEGTRVLREVIEEMLNQGKKRLVLNMGEVYYIDSSGLGEIVAAHTKVARRGGKLALIKLSTRSQELFELTKLYLILEVYGDEDTAVKSFAARP